MIETNSDMGQCAHLGITITIKAKIQDAKTGKVVTAQLCSWNDIGASMSLRESAQHKLPLLDLGSS